MGLTHRTCGDLHEIELTSHGFYSLPPFPRFKPLRYVVVEDFAGGGDEQLAITVGQKCEFIEVRVVSRSISPPWRSCLFRLAPRTYAPWGCIVRVASLTKKKTHPGTIPALFREQVPNPAPLMQCRSSARLDARCRPVSCSGRRGVVVGQAGGDGGRRVGAVRLPRARKMTASGSDIGQRPGYECTRHAPLALATWCPGHSKKGVGCLVAGC